MNISTLNFPAPEDSTNSTTIFIRISNIVQICAYSFNFVFGLPTHSYVLWLIVTRPGSGVAAKFFNLNLSICEIVNSLNGLVFLLSVWFERLKTFEQFLIGLTITGRPMFQSLMCVERYLAVVWPVTFLKYKPLRYRILWSVIAWIITLSSCLCTMFTLIPNTIVHIWYLIVQHKLVLGIQLFCLVAVLRVLKQSCPEEGRRDESHTKRRAFYLILITTISSIFLYAPFAASALFSLISGKSNTILWLTSLVLYVLASFVQPVLYMQSSGKITNLCVP